VPLSARRRSSASAGIARGLLHQPPPVAALRHADLDLVPGELAQRLLEQLALGQRAVDEDRARRRHFLVELRQHPREHLVVLDPLRMARKIARWPQFCPPRTKNACMPTCPPFAASANTSALPTPSALIAWLPWMNVAARSRSRSVAAVSKSSASAAAAICVSIFFCTAPGLAAEEVLRLAHQAVVAGLVDPPDARRRAALDLVQQARPVAAREEAVGAAPQQEQLLQRVDRGVDRTGAGERTVVVAFELPRPAVLHDPREVVPGAQQDEREAFVVAQQHVVRRAEALDQLRLEQQRLGLELVVTISMPRVWLTIRCSRPGSAAPGNSSPRGSSASAPCRRRARRRAHRACGRPRAWA
jgi:hypothetical protein